jgi:hypothetical protein
MASSKGRRRERREAARELKNMEEIPKPPIQPPANAVAPPRQSSKKHDEPKDMIVPTKTNPPNAHKRTTANCRPDQTPIGKMILEVLAVAIGACYTVAALWQLNVMNETLKLERPWVGPASGGDATRLLGDPITKILTGVDWRYQNGGRSPATHVMVSLKFDTGPRARDVTENTLPHASECDPEPTLKQGGILLVPGLFSPSARATVPPEIEPLMGKVTDDKIGLYLIGCVWYTDTEMKKWYKTNVTEI